MNKNLIKKAWLEKFPFFCLSGKDNKRFLNGITTSNILLESNNIVKTCWLDPKGILKALLEIHFIENQLFLVVIEGNVNEIKDYFEQIRFPADDVKISDIKFILRIQEVDDFISWRDYKSYLLEEINKDDFISKNYLSVMDKYDLIRWKISQAIPVEGLEINGKNNPLELGLVDLIDSKKGCYLGQETISRLKNNNSIKQEIRLWKSNLPLKNIELKKHKIFLNEKREKVVGNITSYAVNDAKGQIGLALIKKKFLDKDESIFYIQYGTISVIKSVGSIFLI